MTALCDEVRMGNLVNEMQASHESQIGKIEQLLGEFPEDPRLHFLRGSVLIEEGRLIEAHESLLQAVRLAPDFAIARFQLGFFQLTSGEAANALETWGRLDLLPDGHYLRKFVDGLRCLIRDDFAGAVDRLRNGIEHNRDNPALNHDMQLLINECAPFLIAGGVLEGDDAQSETSFVLQQYLNKSRLH